MILCKSSAKDKSLILNLYKGCGELNGVWGFLVIEVELFRRKMSGAPFEITLFFKITFFNIKELFSQSRALLIATFLYFSNLYFLSIVVTFFKIAGTLF